MTEKYWQIKKQNGLADDMTGWLDWQIQRRLKY